MDRVLETEFGIPKIDALREALLERMSEFSKDGAEADAVFLSSLRSFPACREIGKFVSENPDILQGNRRPTITYPACGSNASILGLLEVLCEKGIIDGAQVRMIETTQYRQKRPGALTNQLERYSAVCNFEFRYVDDNSYVMTIGGKSIGFDLKFHNEFKGLATSEELDGTDILFMHDVNGSQIKAEAAQKTVELIKKSMRGREQPPLVIVDDIPPGIWDFFGTVHGTTESTFGHRDATDFMALPGTRVVEFGEGPIHAAVFSPDPSLFILQEEQLARLASFAFYALVKMLSMQGRLPEMDDKEIMSRCDLNYSGRTLRSELGLLLETINFFSGEMATALVHAFITSIESEPLPTLGEASRVAPLSRIELVSSLIGQAATLALDFAGTNAASTLWTTFAREARLEGSSPDVRTRVRTLMRSATHGLAALAHDPIMGALMRTPLSVAEGVLMPQHASGENLILDPSLMEMANRVAQTFERRDVHINPSLFLDAVREAMVRIHLAERVRRFDRSIENIRDALKLVAPVLEGRKKKKHG